MHIHFGARVQQSVAATYRDDFNKYSHGRQKERIQLVFDRLPNVVAMDPCLLIPLR